MDLLAVLWTNNVHVHVLNPEQSLILSVDKDKLDSLRPHERSLVTIDYFKQFYKGILNPEDGSPGMNGAAVKNSAREKSAEDEKIKKYGFNELSSSKISLERTIPDNRETG